MANILEPGMIVEGTVAQIKPFGAFISLPEHKRGLVHISHISHGYIKEVSDALAEGDTVKVKVLAVDPQTGKISLSIKEASDQKEPPTESRPLREERPAPARGRRDKDRDPNAPLTLDDMLKDWTRQSNDRHADLNRRLKR